MKSPKLDESRRNDNKAAAPIWFGIAIATMTVVVLYPQIFGPHKVYIADIYAHLLVVRDMTPSGPWHLYSVFFALVYVLSFGSKNYDVIAIVATVVLTASVVAKGLITYFVLLKAAATRRQAALLSFALMLIAPLPNWWKPDWIYIDKIVPNIWFNSTAMLTMPFAILLFYATIKWLEDRTIRSFVWIAIFSILSVLTKPNYILAFLPVLGIFAVINGVVGRRRGWIRDVLLVTALLLVVFGILYIQSIEPISSGPSENPNASNEVVQVMLAPFEVWRLYSPNIPVSLLLSIAFPLGVAVLYFKEIKTDVSVLLAWGVLVVAIAQYALLAETGERFTHANWIWASNFAMYVVFLVSTVVLLTQPRTMRFYFSMTLLAFHVIIGVCYYAKIALGLGFY
jgi:hypothetical protein